MEMTEYGKHGKPRSRLSTLPTLFGNPFGITTFPRPRLLAYFKVQEQERPNSKAFRPEGGCNGGPWSKVLSKPGTCFTKQTKNLHYIGRGIFMGNKLHA
jgi:hypothetical protein